MPEDNALPTPPINDPFWNRFSGMRIKISNVTFVNGDTFVNFESKIGEGKAFWKNTDPPVIECEYDVEFNFAEIAQEDKNIFPASAERYSVEVADDIITLNGFIDSIDDDGVAYFRLSLDCLIMIETLLDQIESGNWVGMNSRVSDFEVYAQGL